MSAPASSHVSAVAFVGLGNMGLPMAANLVKAGFAVRGYDVFDAARAAFGVAGGEGVESLAEAVIGADVVVTALPAATHVREAYLGEAGIVAASKPGALFIDCSTIDVDTARAVAAQAASEGRRMLDAPMSGGVGGATAGTLTFMVGGEADAFEAAQPALSAMGRTILHAGPSGAGCAAKLCNNMMVAIQMIAVSEGFNLAEKLGLSAEALYAISSTATARCWSLNDYCPAPGPAPSAPSNRGYAPGFAADLMLKDLRIAMHAAQTAGAVTPMGAQAAQIYAMMAAAGHGGDDFSGVIRFLDGKI